MKIINRNPEELLSAEYNPRELTDKQFSDLKDSITRFGLVDPIIVNTHKDRKNIIVGGHQRLRVAKDMGFKEVPTVEVNLNPDQEKELNIRLNKNTGQWDYDLLGDCFEIDDLKDWGFQDCDFNIPEIEDIAEENENNSNNSKEKDYNSMFEVSVVCEDESDQQAVYKLMTGKGYQCKILSI